MKGLIIGILAHVDSGKTTLSEGMLYESGEIKKLGRVDHGSAFLDSDALERERGITIFSKQAILSMDHVEITLLDTPGHVDFSSEMERTLQVLDYAILVINGADGVQSHTETLWRLLAAHHIPTFLFINKMDLAGANQGDLMEEVKGRLQDGCCDFSVEQQPDILWENLAMCDEALLDQFLETGRIAEDTLVTAIATRKVFPCYFGSALKLQGIEPLLMGLKKYTRSADYGNDFAAKVFKISRDHQGNRLTYLKITGGSLKVKTLLTGKTKEHEVWQEKVNQIRIYSGEKFQTTEEAFPGKIYAVTGLTKTYQGEGLGEEPDSEIPILESALTYRVLLPPEIHAHTALSKLRLLEEEAPALHVVWRESLQEIHVQLMGEVQLEVLKRIIWERFQIDVEFSQGTIIYKETIADTVEGVGHFEPLRHYAEVHLLLEPGERGSGLSFHSTCSEDDLDKNWQHLVLSHLQEKRHVGVLTGSPLTDLKITLIGGRAHEKHTEGGDFREATLRAVRQGLKQAKSVLLEPSYDFKLEVPSEMVGRSMSDIQRMNGNFETPQVFGDNSVLTGSVPLATMWDYQREVTNYTRGKGRLSCSLKGYTPCHNTEEVVAAIGYDSDHDLQNPADSIFCSNGVGVTIKWDQVHAHMHVESKQAVVERGEEGHRTAYCATIEEDQELAAIFQRTYGSGRQQPRVSPRIIHQAQGWQRPIESTYNNVSGLDYLLVDGYNVIFNWDDLRDIARDNLDAARSRLIDVLCNYQGFCQCQLILVFDAYKIKGNEGAVEKFRNIHVVYTKEAETADTYIERATHDLVKHHRVRVVTSDALEQLIILSHGALRIPAQTFREEVRQVEREIRSFL